MQMPRANTNGIAMQSARVATGGVTLESPDAGRYLYFFSADDTQVELFNVLGQSLAEPRVVKGREESSLDISFLADGLYVVRTTSARQGVRTQRIVVRK